MIKAQSELRIFAVIPCLNEEHFIGDIVSQARNYVSEVVVVDDGSTDHTYDKANVAGARVIKHHIRQGAGAATRTGFETALKSGADIIVTLDGDGQHKPEEIPRLLAPILKGQTDLVIGSRFLDPNTNMPGYRKIGIDIITWMFNLGSKVRVTDSQSGFRAHTRKLLESVSITRNDFGFSVEVLVKSREMGFVIAEVPISCLYHSRASNLNPIIHGLSVACDVIGLRLIHEMFRC